MIENEQEWEREWNEWFRKRGTEWVRDIIKTARQWQRVETAGWGNKESEVMKKLVPDRAPETWVRTRVATNLLCWDEQESAEEAIKHFMGNKKMMLNGINNGRKQEIRSKKNSRKFGARITKKFGSS